MKEIVLDASQWTSRESLYESLLPQLGAPEWHGRNLDALADSIAGGDINQVNPPFLVILRGVAAAPPDVRMHLDAFVKLVGDLAADGIPVRLDAVRNLDHVTDYRNRS